MKKAEVYVGKNPAACCGNGEHYFTWSPGSHRIDVVGYRIVGLTCECGTHTIDENGDVIPKIEV